MGIIEVRRATEHDIPWILSELKKFSAFCNTKIPLYPDDDYAGQAILIHINNHLCMVAERSGELLGFVSGIITPHLFNPSIKTLTETFWWVKEEFRGSRAGLMLLNAFVQFGKSNCNWVLMTLESVSPVNERVLTNRGFVLHEKQYLLEVV
jgi:hypothetical protein